MWAEQDLVFWKSGLVCRELALYKLGRRGTTNHNDSDNSTHRDPELQVKYFYQVYQKEILMMSRSFWHLQWEWSRNDDEELDCLE